ncbi:MAG TPA: EAL domain-containing protein, partial [Gallionellaceae bacterium]|nr:EAL domain-containing protein [Gallionellaceae bacterium]
MWHFETEGQESIDEIIRDKHLTALFQPIIDLNTAEIFGYEGLIRGPSDSSLHSPLRLLHGAREAGHLYEMENLCHQVVSEAFIRLNLQGKLFLNISPDVLVRHNIRNGSAKGMLHHIGLLPPQVVIELTEGERAAGYGPEQLLEAAAQCREEGFFVAIDDLGEGFSSLRLWSELRPAFVKVDRHFIQNIDQDPVKVQFLRSIQEIAQRSECAIIAEGIETHSELMVAKSLGISYGQGYYIARPHFSPSSVVSAEVTKALKSFSTRTSNNDTPWGRDSIAARGIVIKDAPILRTQTNQEVFQMFEKNPGLAAIAVVEKDDIPIGLINRSNMIDRFARRYRPELFGKKPCTQFMDDKPLLVDKTASVQEVSKLLVDSDRRHLTQGFIITDNGRYFGVAYGQDLMRVITDMQLQAAKYANPLTQLPGNVPIHEHVDSLLRAQTPFCACYCDLDNFKPFNDVYGFSAGDEVIKLAS